jgi:hypothetical protein
MRTIGRCVAVVLVFGLSAGCGAQRLKPRGQLKKDGQPYLAGEGEAVHIALFPKSQDGPAPEAKGPDGTASEVNGSHPAQYDPKDGSFRVLGADGDGIPPGKYRVTVQITKNRKDLLGGRFGPENSPFIQEITNSKNEIVLDLGQAGQADAAKQPPPNGRRR